MDATTITTRIGNKAENAGYGLTDDLFTALEDAITEAQATAEEMGDPALVTDMLRALGTALFNTANTL